MVEDSGRHREVVVEDREEGLEVDSGVVMEVVVVLWS